MSEKLIRLPQLQRFKTNADATYQGKLTAGTNITISGNTISAQTTWGQQTLYNATITSAGWSGTSNTVSIQGITAGDDVEIVGINPTGLTDQQIQAAKLALDLITYGTTSNGTITFYALGTVPSVDIPVTIRKLLNSQVNVREYTAGDNITIVNDVISANLPVVDYSSSVVINSEVISDSSSYTIINLAKQGRICVISGFVRFIAEAPADTTLFTVPSGALPSSIYSSANATILGEITGDRSARNCQITTAGNFRVHNDATPSSGYMRFNGTYITAT